MMRLLLTFSFCFSLILLKAATPIKTSSTLTDVTVFQNGAQVTRSAKVSLPKGVSTIEFSGISEYMNANTVQITANEKLTLLSVTSAQDYLSPDQKNNKIIVLEKLIKQNQFEVRALFAREDAFKAEKQMLIANQRITDNKNINLAQLKQTALYYGQRILEINLELEKIVVDRQDLNNEQAKLNKQLQTEMRAFSKRTNKIIVQILADNAISSSFKLSYLVPNASWSTTYDAKVDDLSKPITLIHKAQISQQTGENWTNVNLTLATGNPSASAQIPFMKTWYVDLNGAVNSGYTNAAPAYGNANARVATMDKKKLLYESMDNQSFSLSQNITQQEYKVARKQTVEAGAQPSTVVLRELELEAKYEYHAKPRIERDVFLIAKVYNWEKYDLLSGKISLFNNATYVGDAYLNTENPLDTMELSLGRDKNIIVKRTRLIDKKEKSLFGSKRIDNYLWNIEVRNNKKATVQLVLKDQIPVSKNEEVEVSIKTLDSGKLDVPTGIVTWKLKIKPGQSQKRQLGYEVKYPKAKRQNLRFF